MNTRLNQYLQNYFPHLRNEDILHTMAKLQQEMNPSLSYEQACNYFIMELIRTHRDYRLDYLWFSSQMIEISSPRAA